MLINDKKKKSDLSVISLASILKDILSKRQEFTRRRIFLANKVIYDEEEIKIKNEAYSNEKRRNGEDVYAVPRELWPQTTTSLHKQWDSLTGTTKAIRTEDDMVSKTRFVRLDEQIIKIRNEIEFFANKHIMHAATPKSRLSAIRCNEEETVIPSINRLIEISLLCGSIYGELCDFLILGRMNPLPYAQFDKWEGWDQTKYAD